MIAKFKSSAACLCVASADILDGLFPVGTARGEMTGSDKDVGINTLGRVAKAVDCSEVILSKASVHLRPKVLKRSGQV
jgi:hypothetical protein